MAAKYTDDEFRKAWLSSPSLAALDESTAEILEDSGAVRILNAEGQAY